jgi:hypothetical protein
MLRRHSSLSQKITVNKVISGSLLNSNVWVALKRAVLGVLVRYTLSCHGTVPSAEK